MDKDKVQQDEQASEVESTPEGEWRKDDQGTPMFSLRTKKPGDVSQTDTQQHVDTLVRLLSGINCDMETAQKVVHEVEHVVNGSWHDGFRLGHRVGVLHAGHEAVRQGIAVELQLVEEAPPPEVSPIIQPGQVNGSTRH